MPASLVSGPSARNPRAAFSLVELLVVIGILSTLLLLLVPVLQSTRESARRASCLNNLSQFAKAFITHGEAHSILPSGGWGVRWVGDADRGFGPDQPGGWVYSVLPFIDQSPLWERPTDGQRDAITTEQRTRAGELAQTPLPILHCPSRRTARVYAAPGGRAWGNNLATPSAVARTDYCAAAGSRSTCVGSAAPSSLPEPGPRDTAWMVNTTAGFNGVVYQRSRVALADLRDGHAATILVGEKYLSPTAYDLGTDLSDTESAYVGDDRDTLCNCSGPADAPLPDTIGIASQFRFGSNHPAACGYAFADGGVRSLAYDIDPEMLRRLTVRNDGLDVPLDY